MKKTDLATAQHKLKVFGQIHQNNLENLAEIISSAFSALATAEPKQALSVLKQLNDQKKQIESLAKERSENQAEYVKLAVAHMPDSIEFDEE